MNEQHHDDESRRRESEAILRRIRQETEPQAGGHAEAWFTNARGHFAARDVDPDDRIEVIGARIGRLAGLVAFVVLAAMFLVQIAG